MYSVITEWIHDREVSFETYKCAQPFSVRTNATGKVKRAERTMTRSHSSYRESRASYRRQHGLDQRK
jgi:hypothetical protein